MSRVTRSTTVNEVNEVNDDISAIIDERLSSLFEKNFTVFEKSFSLKILNGIKDEVSSAVSEAIKLQNEKITQLESTVELLRDHIKSLKLNQLAVTKKCNDNEQYGRRLCLRFGGLECEENETADHVLEKVKAEFVNADLSIPDSVIDRAHRIGRPYNDRNADPGNDVKCQDIIMRFTTFRHRTLVYRAKTKMGLFVSLDLTKSRYNILKEARELIKGSLTAKYVYADINCRLKVHLINGKELFFESVDMLQELITENK